MACHYHQTPDRLTTDQLQTFFLYLVKQRKLSVASCRLYLNGIRFLYLQVLQWPSLAVTLTVPKRPQRIPELLTRDEVSRIFTACENPYHRMMLITCYGCGLRVSELVSLKAGHIDEELRLLRIGQGKGGKDRLVPLSDGLLQHLRSYWRLYHPLHYLFAGCRPDVPLSVTTAQKAFQRSKHRVGGEANYYHLVFTLPHDLNPWIARRGEVIYRLLFQCVWETLNQFVHAPNVWATCRV